MGSLLMGLVGARGVGRAACSNTPLCPPERLSKGGHLPHKEGDWLTPLLAPILQQLRLVPNAHEGVISPLVGEMPALRQTLRRAEGGGSSGAIHHSAASLTGTGRKSSGKCVSALITG
ncbi:hypothetical protein C5748_13610 [Phyllobacterium phragmitis]|uniref:Uncharacterized protein n=1 Tax=Phyllobacterium phragmitis TaxID=2670329 RepID=A0A2S9IQM3_9HYPH|nr:hypothetical protein C5748_13610 [Phyllobacterium phragmitis]